MGDPKVLDDNQPRGFLATLLGVYLSPGESFVALLRRPPVVAAIVGIVALNLAFTAVWTANVEPREFMKAQIEEAGRWDEIPAERREEVLDQQSRVLPFMAWGGALLGGPILVFLAGGLYLFIFRFFFASEVTFKQSLGIVAIVFLAVGLVTSPVSLLTLALKADWTLNPQMALQANLGAAVEREAVPKALYALLESLDLFTFWLLTLLSIGYAVASRRSTGAAFWGVAAPWALYVLGKVAWAALS